MLIRNTILFIAGFICWTSAIRGQTPMNAETERPKIEQRSKEFSKYMLEGNSVSLAAMYAQNATIGCLKGPEILASLGRWIMSGIKNDSRHVRFKTSSLTADGDLLSEIGTAEGRSEKGEVK